MWQMGGVGPMIGQVHHFLRNAKGKAPYAEERYVKEAHRLYGVLDRRLAQARVHGRRDLFHRRHGDVAVDLALRVAHRRPHQVSRTCCAGTRRSRPGPAVIKGYHVPVKQPGIPMPA